MRSTASALSRSVGDVGVVGWFRRLVPPSQIGADQPQFVEPFLHDQELGGDRSPVR